MQSSLMVQDFFVLGKVETEAHKFNFLSKDKNVFLQYTLFVKLVQLLAILFSINLII